MSCSMSLISQWGFRTFFFLFNNVGDGEEADGLFLLHIS